MILLCLLPISSRLSKIHRLYILNLRIHSSSLFIYVHSNFTQISMKTPQPMVDQNLLISNFVIPIVSIIILLPIRISYA